jgi:hypothetical protein
MTRNNILKVFLELFPNPKNICLDDWCGVMSDISAHFDCDDKFGAYITGLWTLN